MRYLINIVFIILLAGCVSLAPDIESRKGAKTTFDDFVNGTVILPSGNPNSLHVLKTPFELNNQGNFAASALYILEMLPENNLVYHTLGYSAEKLGHFDAAINYYEKSKKSSFGNTFCHWMQRSSFPYYCSSFDPDKSIARVKKAKLEQDIIRVISNQDYNQQVTLANHYIHRDKQYYANKKAGINTSSTYRSTTNGNDFDIVDIFRTIAVIAIISDLGKDKTSNIDLDSWRKEVSALSYDELKERYKRSVKNARAAGRKVTVPKFTSPNVYSSQPPRTQAKAIRSASAGLTTPQSTTNQPSYFTSSPLRSVTPTFKAKQPVVQENCTCSCVNGTVQALCTSSMTVKPICASRICPTPPSSIKPIYTPSVAPVGTESCSLMQVYNESSKKYEWKEVCS